MYIINLAKTMFKYNAFQLSRVIAIRGDMNRGGQFFVKTTDMKFLEIFAVYKSFAGILFMLPLLSETTR